MKRAVVIVFFLLGYATFFVGTRVGYHPYIWRQNGAHRVFEEVLVACQHASGRTAAIVCVRKNIQEGVRIWGITSFIADLEKRQETASIDDFSREYCHDIGHALGQAAGMQTKNISSVFQECTDVCGNGCFHGAIEGWISRGGSFVQTIPTLCQSADMQPIARLKECAHGTGHAMPVIANYALVPSFKLCDNLPIAQRPYCGLGVVMELFEPTSSQHTPVPLPVGYPMWCATLWYPFDEVCFTTAGMYTYNSTSRMVDATHACQQVPDKYIHHCFVGLGKYTLGKFSTEFERKQKIEAYCDTVAKSWAAECVAGVSAPNIR